MLGEVKVKIENIGGIRSLSLALKPGLNLIQAANSQGKSSIVKAFELACLEEGVAENKGHYVNVAQKTKGGSIQITGGGIDIKRKFIPQLENRLAITSDPVHPLAGTAFPVAFVVEENEIMQYALSQESVRDYLEDLAGTERFDDAIERLGKEASSLKSNLMWAERDVEEIKEKIDIIEKRKEKIRELEKEIKKIGKVVVPEGAEELYRKQEELAKEKDELFAEADKHASGMRNSTSNIQAILRRVERTLSDMERAYDFVSFDEAHLEEKDELKLQELSLSDLSVETPAGKQTTIGDVAKIVSADRERLYNALSKEKITVEEGYKNGEADFDAFKNSMDEFIAVIRNTLSEIKKQRSTVGDYLEKVQKRNNELDDMLRMIDKNLEKLQTMKGEEAKVEFECYACGQATNEKALENMYKLISEQINEARDQIKKAKKIEDTLSEVDSKISEKIDMFQEISKDISSSIKTRNNNRTEFEKILPRYKKTLKAYEEQKNKVSKLYPAKDREKKEKLDDLNEELSKQKIHLEGDEEELEDPESKIVDLEVLKRAHACVQEAMSILDERKKGIVDKAVERFNNRVTDLYNKLGFKDFDEVRMRGDGTITVKRAGGRELPVQALSASEKISIGVTLLIAGKEEFAPSFPFFILDETVNAYDPARFEVVKEYVRNIAPYVIVTQPIGDELKVIYK